MSLGATTLPAELDGRQPVIQPDKKIYAFKD